MSEYTHTHLRDTFFQVETHQKQCKKAGRSEAPFLSHVNFTKERASLEHTLAYDVIALNVPTKCHKLRVESRERRGRRSTSH